MSYLRKVWAIVRKDLLAEMRSREMLSSMGAFSVLVILLFAFAFDLRVAKAGTVAPGALWSVIAFAGILGLGRTLSAEIDRGVFDALLLTPVDRSAIFFGNWGDLMIGMWGGLDILVDPYTASTTGTVRVIALQDVDVAVRQPASFAAMLDALTS